LEPLAAFVTNPAGSAIVNALGLIRQVLQATSTAQRRYLVIAAGTMDQLGAPCAGSGALTDSSAIHHVSRFESGLSRRRASVARR
jgi:hypothetical protein